jgi:hypothetical protein
LVVIFVEFYAIVVTSCVNMSLASVGPARQWVLEMERRARAPAASSVPARALAGWAPSAAWAPAGLGNESGTGVGAITVASFMPTSRRATDGLSLRQLARVSDLHGRMRRTDLGTRLAPGRDKGYHRREKPPA